MEKQIKAVRMEVELIKKVEKLAKEENRSFSNMVTVILERAVRESK